MAKLELNFRPLTAHEVAENRLITQAPLWKPLSEFLDEFYSGEHCRTAMVEREPEAEIPAEELAYLAGAVEYLSTVYRLTNPSWIEKPRYFSDRAYFPFVTSPLIKALCIAESPNEFRRRLVFVEGKPLRRKQGPVFAAAG